MFRKYTNSFLNDFDFNEIISIFDMKEFHTFKKDCYIFSENAPVSNIYFILSGKVEIRKSSNINIESLCFIGSGNLIGLEDALTGEKYCNSAYALENTNTVSIKKNDFLNFIKRNNEFNLWILKYLSCRINALD